MPRKFALKFRNVVQSLTLTWDGQSADDTPDFTVTGDLQVGDTVTLSLYSTYSGGTLSGLLTSGNNTIDSGEQTAGTIDFALGSQTAGTYYAQVTNARGASTSYSNVETVTIIAFNPASLFTGGYKGFWLDASDLATMWQNTGGTTAVTADGQSVQRWTDKSGQSHVFTEGTNPPVYKTDGSKHWVLFDSTNDLLFESGTTMTNNISYLTMFIAFKRTAIATSDPLCIILDGNGQERAGFKTTSSDNISIWGNIVDGDTRHFVNSDSSYAGVDSIIVGTWDYTNADMIMYYSQTEIGSDLSFGTAGNTSATNGDGCYIGNHCNSRIYQILAINRALTGPEKANLGYYMSTKSGATY